MGQAETDRLPTVTPSAYSQHEIARCCQSTGFFVVNCRKSSINCLEVSPNLPFLAGQGFSAIDVGR